MSGKSVCLKEVSGYEYCFIKKIESDLTNKTVEHSNLVTATSIKLTSHKESEEGIKMSLTRPTMFFLEKALEDQNFIVSRRKNRKVFFTTEFLTKEQKKSFGKEVK